MKPLRRPICIALAPLLAGVAVNIAVAWTIVLFAPPSGVLDHQLVWVNHAEWYVERSESRGATTVRWSGPLRFDQADWRRRLEQYQGGAVVAGPRPQEPAPARMQHWPASDERDEGSWIEHAAGWPMRSLWYVARAQDHWTAASEIEMRGGINIREASPFPTTGNYTMTALPLIPAWCGFAVNTMFYAGIAVTLWYGPGTVRRAVRRHRLQCASCGYPRTGLAPDVRCPECGAAASRRF